jgi:hypothetical protein
MRGPGGWCIKRSSERDDEETEEGKVCCATFAFLNDTHDLNVFRLLSVYSMEP